MTPVVILGCGYIGARIARAALAAQRPVRVCARSTSRLAPLAELGAEIKYVDAAIPKQLTVALAGTHGGTVIYSIPPVTALPPGNAIRAALQAAYGGGATCFIHFSSSGLYGDQPDDDVWIDEATPLTPDGAMQNVRTDEEAVEACTFDRLRTITLRLAPVYGPGRGVRERLLKNTYRLLDDGQHAISRIFIDDVVRIVFAAEERAPTSSRWLVADDEPTTQGEYARWLCERMSVPLPPSRQMYEAGAAQRATHRNRRIRNAQLKAALGIELKYPTFREGEAAIEAEAATTTPE